jgi:hypothetical protein
MVDAILIKNKLLEYLKNNGPSLPINLAKYANTNFLFTSAFLSELANEKKIKVSNLKVGGSPLYYLEGQEEKLENYYNYLPSKEAESFLLLKNNKILKDSEQEPATRVALRFIKDFAFDFKKDNEIYWRYLTVKNTEIDSFFSHEPKEQIIAEKPIIEKQETLLLKQEENPKVVTDPTKQENLGFENQKEVRISINNSDDYASSKSEFSNQKNLERPVSGFLDILESRQFKDQDSRHKTISKKGDLIKEIVYIKRESLEKEKIRPKVWEIKKEEFNNPLVVKPLEKPKKEKPKSDFVLKFIDFVNKKGYQIIEERYYKTKECCLILQINSELGPTNYLTLAKEKKSVSEDDLRKLLVESQSIPLPALYICTGELNKKAKVYEKTYFSILKTLKMV